MFIATLFYFHQILLQSAHSHRFLDDLPTWDSKYSSSPIYSFLHPLLLSLCVGGRKVLLSSVSPLFRLSLALHPSPLVMLVIRLSLMHFLPFSSIGIFPWISEHWLLYHKPDFLLTLLSSWVSPLLTIKPLERCLYTCCVLRLLTRYSYPVPHPQFSQCSDETFPHRSALLNPVLPLGSHPL